MFFKHKIVVNEITIRIIICRNNGRTIRVKLLKYGFLCTVNTIPFNRRTLTAKIHYELCFFTVKLIKISFRRENVIAMEKRL